MSINCTCQYHCCYYITSPHMYTPCITFVLIMLLGRQHNNHYSPYITTTSLVGTWVHYCVRPQCRLVSCASPFLRGAGIGDYDVNVDRSHNRTHHEYCWVSPRGLQQPDKVYRIPGFLWFCGGG